MPEKEVKMAQEDEAGDVGNLRYIEFIWRGQEKGEAKTGGKRERGEQLGAIRDAIKNGEAR